MAAEWKTRWLVPMLAIGLLAAGLSPAQAASYPENRIKGFSLAEPTFVRAKSLASPEAHQACGHRYDENVSGSPLATKRGATLDLFGGRGSQIPGAINVDLIAASGRGVRASSTALPFRSGSIGQIVASGPQAQFLSEAARVLRPGGRIFINATKGNKFGKIPGAEVLEALGLRVVERAGPLLRRFSRQVFRRADGSVIPRGSVRTTILERF